MIVETLDALRTGKTDADQEVARSRGKAGETNARLRAFTVISEEKFVSRPALPLDGIAIGVKDLYDTAGLKTAYGSPIYLDHLPEADAWLVARLKRLGAFVVGKTETTEFAWRQPASTVNPWNAAHTPGGSSSGSAAAVAAGIVPLALGTQTYGSIIRPAAFCGIVGFKPSRGELSLQGVHPLSPSLDHAGYLARSVADVRLAHALVLDATTDTSPPQRPIRLKFVKSVHWVRATSGQTSVLMRAIETMRRSGLEVTEGELSAEFDGAPAWAETILCHEAADIYGPLIERYPGLVSGHLQELVARGKAVAREAYKNAHAQADALAARFDAEMQNFDAILTLPALGEAPLLAAGTGDAGPCVPWTLLGVPALTLPWAFGENGLPLGIQLIGRAGQDFPHLVLCASIEALAGPERPGLAAP
jgi:amidase